MSASKPFILPTSKPGSIASRIKDLQGGDSDSRDLIRQYKPSYKDFTPSNSYRDRDSSYKDSIFSKNSFNSSNQSYRESYRESSVPKVRESFMSSRIGRDLAGKESNSAEKSRSLDSNSSGVYSNRSFPQGSTHTSPSSSTPSSSTPSSSRSTPPPSADTTSSFRWSDRMKSSPPFNRRTSAEPKKISALSLSLKSANLRSADSEEDSIQTKPSARDPPKKLWHIEKDEDAGQLDPEETSDTASLDLSINFSESESDQERQSFPLQRDISRKNEINNLRNRFSSGSNEPGSLSRQPTSRMGSNPSSDPTPDTSTLIQPSISSKPPVIPSNPPPHHPSPRNSTTHPSSSSTPRHSSPLPTFPRHSSPLPPSLPTSPRHTFKPKAEEPVSPDTNKPFAHKQEVSNTNPVLRSSLPGGYVGFGSLPDQVYRRAVRKGFEFTLMVVGESGLGKSTLVNSMFLTNIYQSGPKPEIKRTVNVEPHTVLLEEGGVKLALTVVDTPGFGDCVNNTDCWVPVTEYIENQFDQFLEAEQRVNRVQLVDTRVHACLYFLAPGGHGLRELDIQAMKRLHDKVNIIPVIGKSDACTQDEIKRFKSTILKELAENQINVYDFPPTEDPEVDWMREQLPFAVVGSNTITQDSEGRRVRGRQYPWGTVNIEDRNHCDFTALRSLLLSHHMQDLKDVTNTGHYETYRCKKLTSMLGEEDEDLDSHPLAQMEHESMEHKVKVERMEKEMEEVFRKKVDEKEEKMRREEEAGMKELDKDNKRLQKLRDDLDRDRDSFNREANTWDSSTRQYNYRVKSEESLGKKKKYGLDRIPFKFGRA